MSATFLDPAMAAGNRPHERIPPTMDLESTTDLTGDHTTDLAPVTTDTDRPDPLAELSAEMPADVVGTPDLEPVEPQADTGFMARELPGLGRQRPPAPKALAPGEILCDRFILERVLGSGGTAIVFQARDMTSASTAPDLRVALKAPRSDRGDRARAAARLHHEFEQASKLAHPNIVRMFDLHERDESCFITMELIEGRLLSTIVRDWTMLPRALANKILRSCALALDHAHDHDVVHGDFKPGNVFLTRDEDVKIVDFGASAALSGGSSRIPAGTPAYASPQVLSGETPDRRDDVFSYACVAYELLTGQHPFQHRSSLEARDAGMTPARAWNLSAPQWLALLSALAWDREQRPEDIVTVLDSLLTESEPVTVAPPIRPTVPIVSTELQPELMPKQRGWGFFVFVACAIVVIFIAWQRDDGPDGPAQAAQVPDPTPQETTTAAPLTSSVVGAVERPRDSLPSMTDDEPFALSEAASPNGAKTAMLSPAAGPMPAAAPPKPSAPPAPLSEISFESSSIVTTESSVAAVFLIKRSQPLRGRARVQWVATSGTADAGIDFASSAAGSVEFADGQAQRAIYVPLRNDLIKEGDETFKVTLKSPQNAKLGPIAIAEATIRDDD
ncbi:MAG TPA: protein kinase [Steroidobacteraceae bacterium]|nr:protein kinase [Steroidobacteraceae bacterium]